MPVVGRITAKFDADTKDLDASLRGIEGAVNGTSATVTAGFSKMEGSLSKASASIAAASNKTTAAVDKLVLKDKLEAGVALFGRLAGAVDGVRQEFNRAGGEADDLRDRLSATFGELADEKAKLAEEQIKLGFDADSTANALVTLKKFGADTEDTLKRLQDAARFTNTDIAGLAESFGRFEKFGDSKSLKSLQKELGISNQDLEKFGAVLDKTGKPLLDTEARVAAAANALREYQAVNFTGAAERQADAATRVAGELEALKREVGLNVTAFKEGFAPAILTVVQNLRGMSDGTKAAIGFAAEFIGTGASMAATGLQIGSQLVLLSQNATVANFATKALTISTTALRTAMAGLATPLGIVGIALTGLVILAESTIGAFKDLYIETDKLTKIDADRLKLGAQNKDLIGKTAAEIKAMGKTNKDVGDEILALQDQVAFANENGATARAEKIKQQIRDLKVVQAELAKLDPKTTATGNPLDPSEKEKERAAKEAAKAAKQAAAEKKKADAEEEKARKDALDAQLDGVKAQAAAGEITKQQQIDGLRDVLNNAQVNASERRTIEGEIATLQGQIRRETTAAERAEGQKRTAEAKAEAAKRGRETAKAEADAKRAAAKENSQEKADIGKIESLAKEKASAEKSAIDKQIGGLDSTKDKAQIEKLIKEKLKITEAEIASERDAVIKATKNEDVKAAAVGAAEAKIKAARADATAQLQSEADKQKTTMQSIADKAKQVAADITQAVITSQVGGKNSPIFSDASEGLGISLGSFSLGGIKKQPNAKLKPGPEPVNATQNPATNPPIVDSKQGSTNAADQIASALKAAPLSITVQTVVGDKKQEKTFSGTSAELAAGLNTFNADFSLGTP